jgi:hypothetical protein
VLGSFVDIPDASLTSFSFVPTLDEDGSLFRCVLRSPGDGDTSEEAVVRVAPVIAVVVTASGTTLTWPAMAGYSVESTGELFTSGTVWEPVSQVPQVIDGMATVTIPPGPEQRFFRLKKL